MLTVAIGLALLLAILVIAVPKAASTWDLSWNCDPPVYYVKITETMIETPHTDFPYSAAALVLGVPPLVLCGGILVVTRPRREPGFCRSCAYDLTGNISGTCPECGTPI